MTKIYFEDKEDNYDKFKKIVEKRGLRIGYVLSKLMKLYTSDPDSIKDVE